MLRAIYYICTKETYTRDMIDIATLRQIVLFAPAREDELNELIRNAPGRVHSYDKGEIIAIQGSRVKSLLVLLSGSIRAQMTNPEGKRLTMDEIDAPDLLAAAFVYSSQNQYPVTIEATETNTLVWGIDREYLLGFMGRHTSIMRSFLGLISDRSHFLTQKINALSLQSLRERLLSYLARHGSTGKQEDLAMLLGVTRPALARLLSELSSEGIITRGDGGYQLTR